MEKKHKPPQKGATVKGKSFDLLRVARHVKFNWFLIILALGVSIAQAIISTSIPNATANLFDGDFSTSKLWPVIQSMIYTILLYIVSQMFSLYAQASASRAARKSIWNRLMHVKMSYYDEHNPADLLDTVTTDAELVGTGLVSILVTLPTYATIIISCVSFLSLYSEKLLPLVGLIILIHIIYMVISGRWTKKISTVSQIQTGLFTGFLAERVRNLPMIKSFSTQNQEKAAAADESKKLYRIGIRSLKLGIFSSFYQAFIYILANVIAIIWGCDLIRSGDLQVYEFVGAFTYLAVINISFIFISVFWVLIKDFNGRSYRLARLCEAPQEIAKTKKTVATIPSGDIRFENVDFAYANGTKTVDNVSFTAPYGKVTALIGPSGSGKTTIIKLLERLYDPANGCITVDGQDISQMNVHEWRKNLAYVVQDAGVFSGTIRECLCYGVDREVSEEELIRVAKLTDMYDYIAVQPLGFDAPVASFGSSLSGGQRQRIVISRALLQDADIMIFDEPTSALDPETANAISRLILDNFSGKTVIIISHELNFISKADNIVFLHNGKIEGEGSHTALMEGCPAYKELMEEQAYEEVFGQ